MVTFLGHSAVFYIMSIHKADTDSTSKRIRDGLVLGKLPFQVVLRQISHKIRPKYRWESTAVMALQEAAEAYLIGMFEQANFIKDSAKTSTCRHKGSNRALTSVLPKGLHVAQYACRARSPSERPKRVKKLQ